MQDEHITFYTPSTCIHSANICKPLECLQGTHFTSLTTMVFYEKATPGHYENVFISWGRGKISNQMDFLTRISITATWLAQISVRDLQMTYLFIFMMTEALTIV